MKHLSRSSLSRTLSAGLGLCALSLPWLAASSQAQVVFSQDFSSSTNTADYIGTGPNQFDSFASSGAGNVFTVSNGALQTTKTDTSSAAINRTSDLTAISNGAATFQFNFSVSGVTANNNVNDLLFLVGSGLNNGTSQGTGICQQYNINLLGGNTFSVFNVNGITSPTFSGLQTITLDLNKTAATVNFAIPGGGTLALASNSFAIYVGNTNVLQPFGANQETIGYGGTGSISNDITEFRLRYQGSTGDNGTVTVDNFVVTAVPEPSTYALLGVGLAGLVAVVAQRRRALG